MPHKLQQLHKANRFIKQIRHHPCSLPQIHYSNLWLRRKLGLLHCSHKNLSALILNKFRQRSANCSNSKKTMNSKSKWWNKRWLESRNLRQKMLNSKSKKLNSCNAIPSCKTLSIHTNNRQTWFSNHQTKITIQRLKWPQCSQSSNKSNQ